jgi:hypothetical protein
VHPSPRPRAARRAATCLLAALATASAMLPGTAAWADDDPQTVPKLLDVPPDHPWRHDDRLALEIAKALPGRTAAQAHRLAVQNLVASSPEPIRRYIKLGDVRGDRFTLTFVGDQACAVWRSGRGPHFATPGPCAPADRIRLADPLRATARVIGFLYDDTLGDARTHRARVRLIHALFKRPNLASLTWQYAPHGVGVAGLIDDNHDGLDDDARLTLHADGRALCVRLGVYPGQHSSFASGECRNLEPRTIHYPRRAQRAQH